MQSWSGARESLLGEILDIGFDTVEADSGGVGVESLPKQRQLLRKFNAQACEGDERMAAAVVAADAGSKTARRRRCSQSWRTARCRTTTCTRS